VFKSQLLGSFCKQIVPLLTEHDNVIESQTKNCMRSQIAHATPLLWLESRDIDCDWWLESSHIAMHWWW